jgi:hypothetical protein
MVRLVFTGLNTGVPNTKSEHTLVAKLNSRNVRFGLRDPDLV